MLQPKDTDQLNGHKTRSISTRYAIYKKSTSDLKTYIESERMKKYIPCKWEAKGSWSSILISDKIDVTIKTIKASACNKGDLGLIPGSGRSPGEGNGNPLQYYWKIPRMEEPGRLQSTGSQRVGHD